MECGYNYSSKQDGILYLLSERNRVHYFWSGQMMVHYLLIFLTLTEVYFQCPVRIIHSLLT